MWTKGTVNLSWPCIFERLRFEVPATRPLGSGPGTAGRSGATSCHGATLPSRVPRLLPGLRTFPRKPCMCGVCTELNSWLRHT